MSDKTLSVHIDLSLFVDNSQLYKPTYCEIMCENSCVHCEILATW